MSPFDVSSHAYGSSEAGPLQIGLSPAGDIRRIAIFVTQKDHRNAGSRRMKTTALHSDV
jgi:hypothetical protein